MPIQSDLKLSHRLLPLVALYALLAVGVLFVSAEDLTHLHTALDAISCVLAAVIGSQVMGIWEREKSSSVVLFIGMTFYATCAAQVVHLVAGVAWMDTLPALLHRSTQYMRPLTWPPTAFVPALGLIASWGLSRRSPALTRGRFAAVLVLILAVTVLVYSTIPPYAANKRLGMTRPSLIGVPLCWAAIAFLCWRARREDRVFFVLSAMALLTLTAHVFMLYSREPHDGPAMAAHLGQMVGYLFLVLMFGRIDALDASKVVEAERELRERTAELESQRRHNELLLNSAGEGLYGLDLDGRVTFMNPAGARILGYTVQEMVGQPMNAKCHHTRADGRSFSREDCPICAALRDGRVHHEDDDVMRHKDGSMVPVEYTSTPLRDQEGRIVGAMVVFRDITARKQAEEALRESEARLRKVIDGLGPYMFVGLMTPDGVLIEANAPALAAAGVKPEDVLGKPFEQTYWWAYSEPVQEQLRAAIVRAAGGTPSRYDVQIRAADGELIWIDFSLYPLRDEAGKIVFLVPSAIVITERRQAEEEIRKLNAELEQRVEDRTRQLAEANRELDAFNKVMVGREQRIIEMKAEVNALCGELGRDPEYPPVWRQETQV